MSWGGGCCGTTYTAGYVPGYYSGYTGYYPGHYWGSYYGGPYGADITAPHFPMTLWQRLLRFGMLRRRLPVRRLFVRLWLVRPGKLLRKFAFMRRWLRHGGCGLRCLRNGLVLRAGRLPVRAIVAARTAPAPGCNGSASKTAGGQEAVRPAPDRTAFVPRQVRTITETIRRPATSAARRLARPEGLPGTDPRKRRRPRVRTRQRRTAHRRASRRSKRVSRRGQGSDTTSSESHDAAGRSGRNDAGRPVDLQACVTLLPTPPTSRRQEGAPTPKIPDASSFDSRPGSAHWRPNRGDALASGRRATRSSACRSGRRGATRHAPSRSFTASRSRTARNAERLKSEAVEWAVVPVETKVVRN